MKKSILDQFASDAINAPAAVTGGGGKKGKSGRENPVAASPAAGNPVAENLAVANPAAAATAVALHHPANNRRIRPVTAVLSMN